MNERSYREYCIKNPDRCRCEFPNCKDIKVIYHWHHRAKHPILYGLCEFHLNQARECKITPLPDGVWKKQKSRFGGKE